MLLEERKREEKGGKEQKGDKRWKWREREEKERNE